MVLGKAFLAPVANGGVQVVLGFAGTDEGGILHGGRGTTEHWGHTNLG
jgi:hypothetical protein